MPNNAALRAKLMKEWLPEGYELVEGAKGVPLIQPDQWVPVFYIIEPGGPSRLTGLKLMTRNRLPHNDIMAGVDALRGIVPGRPTNRLVSEPVGSSEGWVSVLLKPGVKASVVLKRFGASVELSCGRRCFAREVVRKPRR